MKNVSSFYCIGLASVNLVMDTIHNHFGIFDIIFVILAGLPLLLNKKWMYELFGGTMGLISLYIIFAIFVSMVKDGQNAMMQPLWKYGMGYVLSFLTLIFGLLMTKIIKIRNRRNIITSG
ncbi:hypothetical protein RAH57_10175 [Chryseobacterium sp. CKR4-1]|uniref:hypothetical protein n=1 Tax=Chryseobacterium sp. CKR4-1 TaxID=3068896 RepID=UPI002796DA43|nr:hypothetical protein [Chryseobacterium sp. CKR4-1]MDQ1804358.1 hypothetical protein [Chryseobacterium sp. CKR4-1]